MTTRRFRCLPRFSLGNLLLFMVVVGLCVAWYDKSRKLDEQAKATDALRLENVRLAVNAILRSNTSDREKAKALEPHIRVGSQLEEICKWCGAPLSLWQDREFRFADCDLIISCEPPGVVCDFGYFKSHRVRSLTVYVSLASAAKVQEDPFGEGNVVSPR
jgi:hypothetical protein